MDSRSTKYERKKSIGKVIGNFCVNNNIFIDLVYNK